MTVLVLIIYNMADIFYRTDRRPNQVAAISLTMPVFMLFIALGNTFGIGGSSLISRLLGQKDNARASRVSSFCFYGSMLPDLL